MPIIVTPIQLYTKRTITAIASNANAASNDYINIDQHNAIYIYIYNIICIYI